MKRDIKNFESKTEELAQAVASDLIEHTAEHICDALDKKLKKAENEQRTFEKSEM